MGKITGSYGPAGAAVNFWMLHSNGRCHECRLPTGDRCCKARKSPRHIPVDQAITNLEYCAGYQAVADMQSKLHMLGLLGLN